MREVTRHVQMEPFVLRRASFEASEVWHGDEKHATRTQETVHFAQNVADTLKMFQDVPHDHDIEAAGGQIQFRNMPDAHRQRKLFLRIGRR